MKKLTFTIILSIVLITNALAQIEAGMFYLGAGIGLVQDNINDNTQFDIGRYSGLLFYSKSTQGSDVKQSGFAVVPNFGYFVAENFSIGVGLGYGQSRMKTPMGMGVDAISTNSAFIVAPTLRYYLPTSGESFYFFGQFRGGLAFGQKKDEVVGGGNNTSVSTKNTNFDFALSPGFAYFPSDAWSVELLFRGISFNMNDPDTSVENDKTSVFQFDIRSFTPSLGVHFFF